MNYKYLQCNRLKTKEILGVYLTEEGVVKLKERRNSTAYLQNIQEFDPEKSRNKYRENRPAKKPLSKESLELNKQPFLTQKALSMAFDKDTPISVSRKAMNKAFGQFESASS